MNNKYLQLGLIIVFIIILGYSSRVLYKTYYNTYINEPIMEKLDSIKAQNDSIQKELKLLNEYLYD
jgi:hypothetical protein